MPESGEANRHLLLDRDYWVPRLERLEARPCALVQIPRSDLGRPGIEVIEMRLRAHDGKPLSALLAHSIYHKRGSVVQLRICCDLETCAIDWGAVERGASDAVFPPWPCDASPRGSVRPTSRVTPHSMIFAVFPPWRCDAIPRGSVRPRSRVTPRSMTFVVFPPWSCDAIPRGSVRPTLTT